MDFFDLVNISERYMEIVNPSTPEKLLTVGRFLRLGEGSRVIDFGCGYAEMLALWAEHFGITGVGIDVRAHCCDRARRQLSDRGLEDRIEIVCGKGAEYAFEPGTYDAATCIGASFIWQGYAPTVTAMKPAIRPGGRMAIGEPYWLKDGVPPEYDVGDHHFHMEHELLEIARQAGFTFEYIVRSNLDDWDRYEAGNWHGLVRWLEDNPDHPERQDVVDHLQRSQDEYLKYGREYLGWAMYVLAPTGA